MKNILCFGDSNTFGFNPENGSRYDKNTRWTGILQFLCKDNFHIIEITEQHFQIILQEKCSQVIKFCQNF